MARTHPRTAQSHVTRFRATRPILAVAIIGVPLFGGVSAKRADAVSVPGYTLLETISVPTDGSSASSAMSLSSAVAYALAASGTFASGGYGSDAGYIFSGEPSYDYFIFGGLDAGDYGIASDDTTVGGLKSPFWGTYNPDHEYVIDYE